MAAMAKTEIDFYKLYVCLLGTFVLAFCRHVFYVSFWTHVEYGSYNASDHGISDKPLHWVLLGLGDGFTQSLSIQCPSNQTKEATPGITFHQLTFPYPVILSGGNDVTFVQTPKYFQIGLTRVVFTASDSVGNSAECAFHVRLRLPESIPPSIICPINQTEHLLPGQTSINVTFPPPTHVMDNSGGDVALSYSPAPGQVFMEGISDIMVTATDESGNSESCTFYVIIKPPLDTSPPDLTCPQDQLQEVPAHRSGEKCNVLIQYQLPTATDDSGDEVIVQSYPSSGGLFDSCTKLNGMEIEVRATDTSGNTVSCTFWIRWLEVTPTTLSAGTTMRPTTTIKATTRAPTTTQPTTTRPPSTTKAPPTTRPPPSTTQPTTTRPPPTTKAPATTRPPTTTKSPTTTRPSTTTKSPTTTRPPTTTKSPTTTRPPTTTQQPTTTKPSTTRPTTRPHTTTLPPTTRPSTTTKAPTTTKPSTTTMPPQTTRPSTTTKSPSTTRPPTTPGTTRPPKQTTRQTTQPMTTRKGTTKGIQQPTEFDICDPNPCDNEGTCLRDPSNTIFSCVCLGGFMGDMCEINLDITLAPAVSQGQGIQSTQSAIIAVVIGALAVILIIFIILTSIICRYNRGGSRTRQSKTTKPSDDIEDHDNPVFILDALAPDEEDKRSLESHELEHVDEQYQANKDMLAAVTKAHEARTQHVLSNKPPAISNKPPAVAKKNVLSNNKPPIAKKNTYTPTVTFAEEAEEHLYDVTPDVMTTDTEHDYDEVSSIHSDHSYESVDEALKKIRVFVETDDLPESERDEAEKEAAVMEDILNREGLVRIPSTVSTTQQMSVKLDKGRLNNRYLHRK